METKVAIIGIIVENIQSVPKLNELLSAYGEHIIGRMGIPYHKKHVNIITIVIDASEEIINDLRKKIETLEDIYTNIMYR